MAAGLGFKDFTTGEVLTAADVDGYLMQGVWVFASAAARDAAVTSPQEGNFAYLKDTNVTTYYTGSAWANLDTTGMTNPMTTTGDTIYSSSGSTPARLGIGSTGQVLTVAGGIPSWATPAASASGLTLITPTSIANSGGSASLSGAVTTATGVTSVSINGVFSATYDNYIIAYNELIGSGALTAQMRFRVSGTDNTAANYYWADNQCNYTGTADTASNSADSKFWINLNVGSTTKQGGLIQIFSPYVATQKTINTLYQNNTQKGSIGGYHSGTIQADGITFLASANAISGIFRVYGVQK